MKPSTDLFDLIISLTPAEKRYFRLNSQKSGEESAAPNFLRLFDAISSQTTYDEDAIKVQFAGEGIARNLPSEKNYLYAQILRVMRGFHDGNSVDTRLRVLVEEIDFLFERRLYGQCKKMMLRAMQLAERFDRFLVLIQLVDYEVRLHKIMAKSGLVPAMVALEKNRMLYLNRLSYDMEVASAYDQFYAFAVSDFLPGKEITHPASQVLRRYAGDESLLALLSFHRKNLLWAGLALESQLNGNPEKVLEYWGLTVKAYESEAHQMAEDPKSYLKSLANLLAGYHHNLDYDAFPEILEKMRSVSPKSFSIALAQFLYADYYELLYCMAKENWTRCKELAHSIPENMVVFEQQTPDSTRIAFWYNLGVMHFFSGDLTGALKFLTLILNAVRSDIRTDLQVAAEWIFLLVHLEKGNRDVIETHRRNFQRSLNRKDGRYKFEEVMLGFFREYISVIPGAELPVFEKLMEQLSEINEDRSVMVRSGFFEVKKWVAGKMVKGVWYRS